MTNAELKTKIEDTSRKINDDIQALKVSREQTELHLKRLKEMFPDLKCWGCDDAH